MGTCFCKDKIEDGIDFDPQQCQRVQHSASGIAERNNIERKQVLLAATVNKLVLETLGIIGSIVDNEQEPPPSMIMLHSIADKETGWIQVVESMVDVIPMDHPLGPSVITVLLDDCPLPSRESVMKVAKLFDLSSSHRHINSVKQRNICVIMGCIAEKLAGPGSISILTDDTLGYLVSNLGDNIDAHVVLFSLIALEKFAQTSENKATIKRKLNSMNENPLNRLEHLANNKDCVQRQVGFCARWCLDNLFVTESRKYSFEIVDLIGINVMLNTRDVSEYLKISPDGLEARCDAYSFESVRCTFQVDAGCWYYETLIITPGVMQIGWATKESTFLNHEGYGIGDDVHSLAYDGCRRLIWHGARSEAHSLPVWRSGSILGCLLDLDAMQAVFSIDGVSMEPCMQLFEYATNGFFAAASFMSFQQCRFNFGSEPFRFPPTDRTFKSFNQVASMAPEDKVKPLTLYRTDQATHISKMDPDFVHVWTKNVSLLTMVKSLPTGCQSPLERFCADRFSGDSHPVGNDFTIVSKDTFFVQTCTKSGSIFDICVAWSVLYKVVLPRHIFLEQLRKMSVREDSCQLCFDKKASVTIQPCGHRGFCSTCSVQLSYCPMCRGDIESTMDEDS